MTASQKGWEYNSKKTITMARKHLGEGHESSARVALADAVELYDKGDYYHAYNLALTSLAHSTGVFHADYQACS